MSQREPRPGVPFSARMRGLGPRAEQLEAILDDRKLTDTRRAVALTELLISEVELVPSDARIEAMAQNIAGYNEEGKPNPIKELHREEARLHLVKAPMALIERYSRQQVAAARQLDAAKALGEVVLPLVSEVGYRMIALLDKYVPEADRPKAKSALREDLAALMARMIQDAQSEG